MGSPDFAVPILEKVGSVFAIAGVVTQPDRPAGRGRELQPPPVKETAIRMGIPFIQPEDLKTEGMRRQLALWNPDLILVAAYGQILPPILLDLPRLGCVNAHASVLPRWRGASPIQSAIMEGDSWTGITIMKMDAGLDTGDILAVRHELILPTDTAKTLEKRLAVIGADLLVEILPGILAGTIQSQPQDNTLATYCGRIEKKEGLLDFNQPADVLERRIRAFNPWPSTWFFWNGQMIKIHAAHILPGEPVLPGQRGVIHDLPMVGTTESWLVLDILQPAGKKKINGNEFLNGSRNWNAPGGFIDGYH